MRAHVKNIRLIFQAMRTRPVKLQYSPHCPALHLKGVEILVALTDVGVKSFPPARLMISHYTRDIMIAAK